MKKIELLSGAGDLETLKVAIKCGADAVYVSLKDYGARKYAKNFTMEELIEATKYCHLYGARIYVTINTLIHDTEIEDVLDTISKLYDIGVDALIMQDVGLIALVRKMFPNVEVHISTQAHNISLECIKFWEKLGVKRVVLARELSIDEIRNIKTPLELEVFIHGALCVCYSGQCLISSRMFERSGNRGECAQVCRFCFDMYKNDEKQKFSNDYLLSMKDLCGVSSLEKLISSGVTSLKIEGRMKSKYYVGTVTKFYRNLIDKYYNNEPLEFTEEEYKELLTVYNREFTDGFLGNDSNVVNSKTCNHQGVLLGKVLELGKRIKILLSDDLYQEDGVRFSNNEGMICNYIYNAKGLLINKAKKGDVIYLDNKVNLKEVGNIYKTSSIKINERIDNMSDKKIEVGINSTCKIGEPVTATIKCEDTIITKFMGLVEEAVNSPVTKSQIIEKFSKLGNTPFVIKNIKIDMDDNAFVPLKVINELRRELTDELISIRESKKYESIKQNEYITSIDKTITNEISFLVRNEVQLKKLIKKNVNIYVEDYNLYKKYKNDNVYYRPLRACTCNNKCDNVLITNNGYFDNNYKKIVTDIYMNVYNSLTTAVYSYYSDKVGLSPELNNSQIECLIKTYNNKLGYMPNVEVLVYGKLELMIMKYCPIKNMNEDKACSLCSMDDHYLDDKKDHRFKLLKDGSHKIRVMDYQNIDKMSQIEYLKSIGVTNFRIDLLDEGEQDIDDILNKLGV